jgi:hypothetical protein
MRVARGGGGALFRFANHALAPFLLLPPSQFFPEVHCRAYDCTSATVPLPPRPDTDPYCKVREGERGEG